MQTEPGEKGHKIRITKYHQFKSLDSAAVHKSLTAEIEAQSLACLIGMFHNSLDLRKSLRESLLES